MVPLLNSSSLLWILVTAAILVLLPEKARQIIATWPLSASVNSTCH